MFLEEIIMYVYLDFLEDCFVVYLYGCRRNYCCLKFCLYYLFYLKKRSSCTLEFQTNKRVVYYKMEKNPTYRIVASSNMRY